MSSLAHCALGSGTRLVALHGFTQDASHFSTLAPWLTRGRELVSVDLPGHGASGQISLDLEEAAEAVLELADDQPIDLLGYSLGARTALIAALTDPAKVRRLVLISGTAGIADDQERARRRASDTAMADALEANGDVEAFLERWLSQPMFNRLGGAANLAARRANSAAGLASSLRTMGTGTMAPRWDALGTLMTPTLLIAGANDIKFAGSAQQMHRLLGASAFTLIPGANHACHLESPERVGAIIAAWLDGTDLLR